MNDTGTAAQSAADKAIYTVFIAAPVETVWNTLVATDEVLPFFFGAICRTPGDLMIGTPMAMETPNGKFRSVVGTVLAFDPPHRYSHTFKFTGYDDPPCTVTYELEAVDGGTQFSLVTTNVPRGTKTENDMARGGTFIVNTLKSVVETGKPSMGTRFLLGLMGLAAPFVPKESRSENWPFERISELQGRELSWHHPKTSWRQCSRTSRIRLAKRSTNGWQSSARAAWKSTARS